MTVQFHETVQGRRYYERTLPELLRQVTRLADAVERVATILETQKPEGGRDADHQEDDDREDPRGPEEGSAPR